ncbi:MAG: PAS domain S-box protein [Anaerolineales bacterium]
MKLLRMARRQPEFKVFLQNPASQPSVEQQAASDEVQRRAIYHGEWQPYIHILQTQGMQYAQAGLSFPAWFEIVGAFRKFMLPYLLEAYGKSPKRLSAALSGIDTLFDLAMSVIGESYLETKQELIQQQGQTIQQGQSQLAGIINSAMDAIITIDEGQRILVFNPAAEKMFQRFANTVIGKPLTMLIPERLRSKHPEDVRGFGKTSITKRSMGRLGMVYGLRANGEEFPLEASISQAETEGKKTFTAILRDITERQQAEQELRFMASIVESATDAIIGKTAEGIIVSWNPGAEKLYGYKASEVIGKSISIISPPEKPDEIPAVLEKIKKGERIEHYETVRVAKDGRRIDISLTVSPIRNNTRNIIGASAIARDITELKQAQEGIRQLNTELEQRVLQRTAQLEAANKELESFSYSVSHDLRAPLRSIDGFSQALLEDYADQLPPEGRSYLERVRAAAQHMAELIDDLLNLSRVTRASIQSELTDLSAIARQIADELMKLHPERNVRFDIAPNLTANGDPHLLQIVMENLLNNAWKFTSKQTEARIEFNRMNENGTETFFVRDNGVGFDMKYVDKLFGAFQRLHSASEFPGTGIGLATIQRVIHKHGGRIWAEGAVDQGATFYFTL